MSNRRAAKRKIAFGLGAAALAASTLALVAGPVSAGGNEPFLGALCQARENIQFYVDPENTRPSYVVKAHENIRIDNNVHVNELDAQGHGTGHATRWFQWKHMGGGSRLYNCR